MISGVKFDTKGFSKILKNSVEYSQGFIHGAESNMIVYNKKLSDIAAEALKRFIDTKARMSPESLHHIYEWNRVGDPSARLFEIDCSATKNTITLFGKFLPSNSISDSSQEPFRDKARIMENKIAIEISPRTDVLAFEVEDQTVFTTNTILIENPGGDAVAGSFGRAVEEFFDSYFTGTVLREAGFFSKLKYPKEFGNNFSRGAMGGGRSTGVGAGRSYMDIKGVDIA